MDISSSVYSDNMTLAYLTNPLYQSELARKVQVRSEVDISDVKFYKKRIIAITREMFRKEGPSEDLKRIHSEYVTSVIKHFKMTDKKDILQDEYGGQSGETRYLNLLANSRWLKPMHHSCELQKTQTRWTTSSCCNPESKRLRPTLGRKPST